MKFAQLRGVYCTTVKLKFSDDEEARLRQKLLEKRGAMSANPKTDDSKVSRNPKSSTAVASSVSAALNSAPSSPSTKIKKTTVTKSEPVESSDDEEMFSMQPKDLVNYSCL